MSAPTNLTFNVYIGDSLNGDNLIKSEAIMMELEEIHEDNSKQSLDKSELKVNLNYDHQSITNENIKIKFREINKDTINQHLSNSESNDDECSDMLSPNAAKFTSQDHENTIEPHVIHLNSNDIVGDDQIINNHDIIIKLEEIDEIHFNRPSINSESKGEENSKTLLSHTAIIMNDVEVFKSNKNSGSDISDPEAQSTAEVECSLCREIVIKKFLPVHILKEHCKRQIIKCTLCEYKSDSNTALRNHFKGHRNDTSFCDLCKKNFKDLDSHVKYFHDMKGNYHCTYCEKKIPK